MSDPPEAKRPPTISIIIPTLNEARAISATLERLRATAGAAEIIVVDGGSSDATTELARREGARVLRSERGRGSQMRAGASAASGDVLWFVHADTQPPADAVGRIREALRDPGVAGGNFRLRFGGSNRAARFMSWFYPRLAWIGLCYGDAAMFVRRADYEQVGGFRPFPIFEDLDLVRRLKKNGRFVRVASEVVTSSRRFEGRSFLWTFTRWVAMQVLYWLGVDPQTLGRFYAPIR